MLGGKEKGVDCFIQHLMRLSATLHRITFHAIQHFFEVLCNALYDTLFSAWRLGYAFFPSLSFFKRCLGLFSVSC